MAAHYYKADKNNGNGILKNFKVINVKIILEGTFSECAKSLQKILKLKIKERKLLCQMLKKSVKYINVKFVAML